MRRLSVQLVLPSILLAATLARAETVERVVAKVNGQIITLSEFQTRQLEAAQAARVDASTVGAFLRQHNAKILQDAIDEILILQKAEDAELKPPALVRRRGDRIDQEGAQPRLAAGARGRPRARGADPRRAAAEHRAADPARDDHQARHRAEDDGHRRRAARGVREAARQRVHELRPRSRSRRSWSRTTPEARRSRRSSPRRPGPARTSQALAKAHSAAATRAHGGEVGEIAENDMNPELRKVVLALPIGGVSQPMRIEGGYRIVKVTARTAAVTTPFEAAREKLRDRVMMARFEKEYDAYVQELRKNAQIELRVREVPLQLTGPIPEGSLLEGLETGVGGTPVAPAAGTADERPAPDGARLARARGSSRHRRRRDRRSTPQAAPERIAPRPPRRRSARRPRSRRTTRQDSERRARPLLRAGLRPRPQDPAWTRRQLRPGGGAARREPRRPCRRLGAARAARRRVVPRAVASRARGRRADLAARRDGRTRAAAPTARRGRALQRTAASTSARHGLLAPASLVRSRVRAERASVETDARQLKLLAGPLAHEAGDGLVERAGVDLAPVALGGALGLGADRRGVLGSERLDRGLRDETRRSDAGVAAGSPSSVARRPRRDRPPPPAPRAVVRRRGRAAPGAARASAVSRSASSGRLSRSVSRLGPAGRGPRAASSSTRRRSIARLVVPGSVSKARSIATSTVASGTPASYQLRASAKSRGAST